MDKYNNFTELNNVALKIILYEKEFDAEFIVKNDNLLIRVDMTNDIELWRILDKKIKYILGTTYVDNINVTLFDCQYSSMESTGGHKVSKATIDYYVSRILLGLHTDIQTKEFTNIEVVYDDINCLTNDKPYEFDYKKLSYTSNPTSYRISVDNLEINLNFACQNIVSDNSLSITRNTCVEFINKEAMNFENIIDTIYKFRNFLMLILRRSLYVKKHIIIIGDKKYRLFDCYSEKKNYLKESLKEHLDHRCLKIENIGNMSEIYKEFLMNYDHLYPLIEIYFDLVNYRIAELTMFISITTMLEYYSNEYDSINALALTKSKKPKKINPEYVDMVKSLISNVNIVYNYTSIEIDFVSENVKNARTYYIHYIPTAKKLIDDDQFKYSYFLIDIILLNLYKVLKFNEFDYMKLTYLDYYYDKNKFL